MATSDGYSRRAPDVLAWAALGVFCAAGAFVGLLTDSVLAGALTSIGLSALVGYGLFAWVFRRAKKRGVAMPRIKWSVAAKAQLSDRPLWLRALLSLRLQIAAFVALLACAYLGVDDALLPLGAVIFLSGERSIAGGTRRAGGTVYNASASSSVVASTMSAESEIRAFSTG